MEQRTGLRARQCSELTSKLLIFGCSTSAQGIVQCWPGAIIVCGWEGSERYVVRDHRIQCLS
jgi:hypothetical protein